MRSAIMPNACSCFRRRASKVTHTHTHIHSLSYKAYVPENQSKSITISFDLRLQSGTALFDVIQCQSCVPSLSSQFSHDLHYRFS